MYKEIPLRKIAHARTGDKFDTSLIAVLPYDLKHKELIRKRLTPEYVERCFSGIVKGRVERNETPFGFIFVLHAALDGGVVAGYRIDGHGKSLSGFMLEIPLLVDAEYEL